MKIRNVHLKDPLADRVLETDFKLDSDIPKKYRKSIRKLSALAEEFAKNSSLLDVKGNGNREV